MICEATKQQSYSKATAKLQESNSNATAKQRSNQPISQAN